MGIADKLVLQRQRHLKWKALDPLEMILMIICGLTLFGFSMSVCADITTRIIGRPWLWLQEVTSTLFIYGIFIGAAVATRRNDHLYLTAVAESMHGKARLAAELLIRLIVLVVAVCMIYYGYLNYLRGFGSFRLPSNTPIASLYAAIPISGALIALLGGVMFGATLADVSLASIIQKVVDGVDNEALLAIPFFLLVGELMSSANVVVRIANLSMVLVGHIRGGLSQVVTVFSMFFSEMSGSTTADVAVMSRALAGPMKKEGYEGPFIAAIIAAASTIAALVPPSITAVVYGATGNVSIAGLFMAGFMPGLMIGFGLMTYCYFFGPIGFKRPRASFGMIALATRDAALPLMIPVILLGGILSGWFTPTEAGVVAALWIIVVIIPALNPRHIWNLPYDFCLAGLIFSLPLITIGAANAFGYLLAYLRGAIVISEWIIGIAGTDPHLIMLLMVLLFTIVGDFIEPVPTIIIFMPLVNALTAAGHINPVHMGVVLIATLAFGLITPPYGLVLLMASKFVGVRFSQALRAALPIYVVFFATIAFCIFFPEIVLWLPRHVLPASVGCFQNPNGSGLICPHG